MDNVPSDDTSVMVRALRWASIATTISLEMVVPPLAGYGLDRWLGTIPLFVLLGAASGVSLAIWHLIRQVAQAPPDMPDQPHSSRRP